MEGTFSDHDHGSDLRTAGARAAAAAAGPGSGAATMICKPRQDNIMYNSEQHIKIRDNMHNNYKYIACNIMYNYKLMILFEVHNIIIQCIVHNKLKQYRTNN
jgi:hypothetical protein